MSLCAIIPVNLMQSANDSLEQQGFGGGLTQQRLKELYIYNPETGLFYSKGVAGGACKKSGEIIGSLRKDGYVSIKITTNGKMIAHKAHRLAFLYMNGEFPKESTDHINGIKSDNRWCNLREVNRSENMWNRKMNSNNKTGYKGVYPYKGKFKAMLRWFNKLHTLGVFDTEREAATVVGLERLEQHGSHARFE